jgi:hypothetical protein
LLGSCSFIGGGTNNISSGACSAILGGQGNNDSGFNDVFIAGSGIAAVNPASLHINGLWANGILYNPLVALPVGTVFAMPVGSTPTWAYPLTTGVLWIA